MDPNVSTKYEDDPVPRNVKLTVGKRVGTLYLLRLWLGYELAPGEVAYLFQNRATPIISATPTVAPTSQPTLSPTMEPSVAPTSKPSPEPIVAPTNRPTTAP